MECYETAECVFPFAGWWNVHRREQHSHCHHQHNQWQLCNRCEMLPIFLNRYVTVHRPDGIVFLCSKCELCRFQGGGIRIYDGTLHAQDCIISRNTASGVSCISNLLEPLRNSPSPQWSVMKLLNSSSPLQGGGVAIEGWRGSSTVTVTTCTISGNTASYVSCIPNILEPSRNGPSPQWIFFPCVPKVSSAGFREVESTCLVGIFTPRIAPSLATLQAL
jgi:hypothetical protein